MPKFNFDNIVPRRGSNCLKWDSMPGDDIIPLWVADMDFHVAPAIQEALRRRTEHGVFGYEEVPDRYYDAIINWFSRRHGWTIKREWIQYTTGVIPAIAAVLKALTMPADKVVMLTPIYNCFFANVRNSGCVAVESPLHYDGKNYTIDYDRLERDLADARVLIFCNPHNPAGRVWKPEELRRVGELCLKHGVIIISDEIHCELVMPGFKYTPMATISQEIQDITVTCNSSSKSFNIAGLQVANIVCNNAEWRNRIDRALNINETCDVNPFGVEALIAAYNDSEDWIDELNVYIKGNYDLLRDMLNRELPQLTMPDLEGTYLAWVDCSALGMNGDEITDLLLDKARVRVNCGSMYGKAGLPFIRINLATSRGLLAEAFNRIIKVLKTV